MRAIVRSIRVLRYDVPCAKTGSNGLIAGKQGGWNLMDYCVPVNAPEEVSALVAAGADELYCGYQDAKWIVRYGDHDSVSRRQGRANLSTRDELERTVAEARLAGAPLFLALNARYTEPQLDCLLALCADFAEMGGTGIIASDLGLLWNLRDHPQLQRTLSLLSVAQNAPTLAAFAELGVSRVVFPRFVGSDEAKSLLSSVSGMQGEFMAFFDKCPLVDGYCRHRHGVGYADRQVSDDVDDAPPLFSFDTVYRTHACLGSSCDYLDPYPCAACTLGRFEAAGVKFAKLGGRGRSLDERLRALRFLREAKELPDDGARKKLYVQTFETECACYYEGAMQNRYAIQPVAEPEGSKERLFYGSQTDFASYSRALEDLCCGGLSPDVRHVTLLVPPLPDEGLATLRSLLPALCGHCPEGTHLCVNDLGTLISVSKDVDERALCLEITFGTLLARLDDPAEIAHFLSADENPSRPIWDTEGNPRLLTYREPPEALVEHWRRPSLCEPSSREALRALVGHDVAYEF